MNIKKNQLETISGTLKQDFLSRLDLLLQAHNATYAAASAERRFEALGAVVSHAEEYGIREELNLGLFALAVLVFGVDTLRGADLHLVMSDPHRTGAAKVYQFWAWCRRQFPDAAVFKEQAAPAR